jgi:Amt family ammonium transporter
VRRKNALSLLLMPMLALAVISVQWYLIGYSLAFSDTGGPFIGDLKHAVLRGVMEQPIPQAGNKIPAILYYFYQNMFAALVPAIAIGAAAERGRIGPTMIFVFFWSTIVYCPVAHWIWVSLITTIYVYIPLTSLRRLLEDGRSNSVFS